MAPREIPRSMKPFQITHDSDEEDEESLWDEFDEDDDLDDFPDFLHTLEDAFELTFIPDNDDDDLVHRNWAFDVD